MARLVKDQLAHKLRRNEPDKNPLGWWWNSFIKTTYPFF